MKRIHFLLIAFGLAGCMTTSPELTAWRMAREVNTPAAYEDYSRRYPKGDHVDEARDLVGKSKMERIEKASTVAECVAVLKTASEAKTIAAISETAFKAAQKETSPGALYLFLATFKGHSGAPAVRTRLEELEFESAGKNASPAAMEYFVFKYPGSRFAGEARKFLAEKSYQQARSWGSQNGYKAFVARFPDNGHAAEVRGLIRTAAPHAGAPNVQQALAAAVEKSPSLKKYGCALSLSASIRRNEGDVDSLRQQLYDMEKGTGSGSLPEACASAGLKARPGAEGSLSEALTSLGRVEDLRKDLAGKWEVYRQREEVVKAAVVASTNVANDLETAEISEEVLGTGPLGRMDIGAEKGSVSAKKALDRFQRVQAAIGKDRADLKRLLVETDVLYRPLQSYVTSCVEAK